MQPELTQEPASDLFQDHSALYVPATTGQRFLNYLIDAIVMQYGLAFLTGYLLARILLAISPDMAYELLVEKKGAVDTILVTYLLAIINYLLYYTICEKAFKGQTLGKLVTGTRAVREDGKELTFKDCLLRSLSRLVPFEPFSIWFGSGLWHDRWTDTTVIKSR